MCVFAGKKNYFIFYNKTTEKRGILHSWIANRLWGNCIALVIQNCLSINQSTNQTINTLRRNQSQQPFQTSRNQFSLSLSLSLTCRKHTGNILSLHTHLLSLFFSSLSSSFSFFPEKIERQLHDFTLIFLDFFLLFLSYSLLVWVSMICLILSFFFKFNNDLQAKLPRVFPQSLIVHFRYPTHRGSLTFFSLLLIVWNNSPTLGSFLPRWLFLQQITHQVKEKRTSSAAVCESTKQFQFPTFGPLFNGDRSSRRIWLLVVYFSLLFHWVKTETNYNK